MPDDAISHAVHTIPFDPAAQRDAGARVTTKLWYSDPDGAFRSGFWAAQPGKAEINYTKDELCMLLEGAVRLTLEGQVFELAAGDSISFRACARSVFANPAADPARYLLAMTVPSL